MTTHTDQNIPEWWREITLKEVIESANTGLDAITRAPIVPEDTGIKCFRIQDASQSKDYKNWGFTNVNQWNYNKFKLLKGDILIARTGNSIGVNFLVKEDTKAVYNNWIIRLRVNNETLFDYLYKIISSEVFDKYIQSIAYGTSTQPNMQINALLSFNFLLPLLSEQRAIADILSSFDDKIKLLQEQNETLEATAQTIFHEWFGRYSVESPEELPDGWRMGRLWEIAEITSWKRPWKISDKMTVTHNIPLLWASKIMGYVESHLFDWKTLVIGRVGTHGEIQKFNEKIFPSDNTLVIKSDNFVFVYLILKNIDYGKMNRWAVQPLITQTDMKNYPVIIPLQEFFNSFKISSDAIFDKIENNNSQIQSLIKTRDELLPRLMNGEVRVTL